MANLTPPRAGIPIGRVNVSGQDYEVAIHPEWLRYLANGIFERVGGVTAPTNTDLDAFLQFDIREADAAELQKRVRDLETVTEAPTVAIQTELAKRVADLETSVSLVDALQAQIAQLSARIADLETQGAFR